MEINDDEMTTVQWQRGQTSECHGPFLPTPEPSSSSSTPWQSLNKLKRKASSPSDISYEWFSTSIHEVNESFDLHDDTKSLQLDPFAGGPLEPEPCSSYPTPAPDYASISSPASPQFYKHEPKAHIPPRRQRLNTDSSPFVYLNPSTSSSSATYLNPSTSSSASQAARLALHLHWQLLSYHVAQPDLFLHFDVAFPIHDIEYRWSSSHSVQQTPLCNVNLDKPAADKELTNMTIKFQRNLLQWDINVRRDEGIRVCDVFEAIYSAFDIPLTSHEKSLIPLRLRAGCEEAFRLRCSLAPVPTIVQQRQGWKRIDVLLHETLFRGLTQSKSGGDLTLNLSCTNLRTKRDSNIMDGERLMSDPIVLRYWQDIRALITDSRELPESANKRKPRGACARCKSLKVRCEFRGDNNYCKRCIGAGQECVIPGPKPHQPPRQWLKDLMGDVLVRQNPLVDINIALPQPDSLIEYLPPYPNQNLNALSNISNHDMFNLPLSAAFVTKTGVDSDILNVCRICNFTRLRAIIQHRTLCNLLNNIPPLIPEPSSRDYTWAFFCKFVPLCALFDSPGRGPLPMIQLSSDRARLVERLEVDLENSKNTMLWLHGPSGTGKSVIAYILASRCRQKNRLAGSFFFSRRHVNCRSARSLVFALAYQLGLSQPQAKEKIIEVLDSDPGIISPSRDLREQFARLLIEPLEAIDWRSPSKVFVVDAIDQCQGQVSELISLLTRLFSHLTDVGVQIVFTSRDHMEGILIKRHLLPIISDIALDRTDATGDVKSFLRQSFDKTYRRHRLQCCKPWPPDEVLDRLTDSVGSHFVTGLIIVKFVDSPDHDPIDRMDLLHHLPLTPSSPPELTVDNFYKYIISTADDPDQAYLHLTFVANIVGMLSCLQLNNLLKREPNQIFDFRSVLSQLSPLVHIPDGHDSAVQVCHESLCDFLSDPLRCGEQFIPQAVVHRVLAYSSLSIMMKELPDDSPFFSHLSWLTTESSLMSLSTFDNTEVLELAIYSPPEPLPLLSTFWKITQRQCAGLQADSRTALALRYFCCTWQILQHLDLSTVDALPAFRFLTNIRSLPALLAFPIFLAFESPRSNQTMGPSELRIETLHTMAEIVNDVHAVKDRCILDSGALDYACTHWAYHLSLAEWDDDLRSILMTFMRQKLQQWLVKAWCLQDFETCLRTLCEVRELCLTANPPIHFNLDAQHTADMKAEEDTEKASLVGRRENDQMDLFRGTFTGRGGCWTCRLRRKKCDEQREDNSCHTCKRLRLDCLGWGTRRPEWMRDKKAVDDYKAGIKAQLTRTGLVRGQPKLPLVQTNVVASSSTPSSSSVFAPPQFQGSAGSSWSSEINDLEISICNDSLNDATMMEE